MKKSNWYEFKKLYTASNPDDCLFHAYVADKDNYRIIIDENNIFTEIFLSIITGEYIVSPIVLENNKLIYNHIQINNQDAIENLKQYINNINNQNIKEKFILTKIEIDI